MAHARKAETEQKRAWIGFRGTDAQRREIERKAALLNLSLSEYVRRCAVQGTVRVVQEEGHDPAKVRALAAIGNNLNQIARRMNAGGAEAPPQLGALLEAIQEIIKETGTRHGPTG